MTLSMHRSKAGRLGEAALWTGAATFVLAAHIAAAAVALREQPIEASDAAPPAAIMIELAPEPVAAATDETVVSDELQDSQEVKSETAEPVEEPPPEPVVEPLPDTPPPEEVVEQKPLPPEEVVEEVEPQEPVPEVTQTIPEEQPEQPEEPEPVDPVVEQQLAMLENVEVPLPVVRPPEPEEVKEEAPKPEPKKVAQRVPPKPKPPAAKAAQQAKAEVQQADQTAATRTSESLAGSSVSPARWQARLAAHLARQRGKCPATGRGSTAYVTFRIDNGGNLSGVSLSRSSGYADFDSYMVDLVRRASPVPPPPAGIGDKVTVPLGYKNC